MPPICSSRRGSPRGTSSQRRDFTYKAARWIQAPSLAGHDGLPPARIAPRTHTNEAGLQRNADRAPYAESIGKEERTHLSNQLLWAFFWNIVAAVYGATRDGQRDVAPQAERFEEALDDPISSPEHAERWLDLPAFGTVESIVFQVDRGGSSIVFAGTASTLGAREAGRVLRQHLGRERS